MLFSQHLIVLALLTVACNFVCAECSDDGLDTNLLETLMYRHSTDKSRDDHNYVGVYANLFDHLRLKFKNITEIGIAQGYSLQVWAKYFSNAQVNGYDLILLPFTKNNLKYIPNVKLYEGSCLSKEAVDATGFIPESMDLIIDDGPHDRNSQELTLENFFRYVKPGGFYIIEDVDFRNDGFAFIHHPERLRSFTDKVFKENYVFFTDTHIGHRNWDKFRNVNEENHEKHNSNLIVIRKRVGPVPPILTKTLSKGRYPIIEGPDALQYQLGSCKPPANVVYPYECIVEMS